MARRKISQWQARAYKRDLEKLQAMTRSDRSTYGAQQLTSLNLVELHEIRGVLKGARDMRHPLVCRLEGNNLQIYGVR